MLPSEIFARQVFTTYEDEKLGVELIPRIGVDNVMWASDYPHGDSTWPHSAQGIGRVAARAAWPRSSAQGDLRERRACLRLQSVGRCPRDRNGKNATLPRGFGLDRDCGPDRVDPMASHGPGWERFVHASPMR